MSTNMVKLMRIFSRIGVMKNLFNLLFSASIVTMTVFSCNKGLEEEVIPESQTVAKHRVTVTADYSATTKTEMLPAGNQTKWTDDDIDNMHFFENGIAPDANDLLVSLNADKTELTIAAEFANTDVDKYVYTSILASNLDADKNAILDDEQLLLDGTFDPLADILVAKPEEFDASQNLVDFTMQYKRVVAINKIKIKGLTEGDALKSVTISSNKALLGSYSMTNDTWTNSGNTLELTASNNITVPAAGEVTLWFITAPVTDATLSIYVVTDKHQYEKDFTKTISFAANTVTSFATTVANSEVEVKTGTNDFIRVESTNDLTAGEYVLVNETNKKVFTGFSTTSTIYGLGADVTIDETNHKIANENVTTSSILTLAAATTTEGAWVIKQGNKLFNWSSGNSLTSATEDSKNTNWTISVTDGTASIVNVADGSRVIKWNSTDPRFACYTSGQSAVQLYKKDEGGATKSPLAKPVISTEKTETLDGIIVSWTDVAKAANYTVSCTGQEDQTISAGVQTATFANLEPGTYTVSVTANPANTDRNTASTSDEASVEILDYQLVAPTVSFSGNTTTSIVATWNADDYDAGKVASYSYMILDGETVVVEEKSVTTGSFEEENLTSNHTYTVKFKVNGKAPYKGTEYVSLSTKTLKESLKTIAEIKAELKQNVTTYEAELTNATITGKWDNGAFIEDATAGIYIYGEAVVKNFKVGDSYTGKVSGTMTTYKGQPELTSFDLAAGYTKAENVTLPLTEVSWTTLLNNMDSYDGKRVKILKGKLATNLNTASGSTANISYGEHTLKVLSRATLEAVISSGTYVDVIGFPTVFNETDEIIVTDKSAITESSITWRLKSIAIKNAPTKLTYTEGETFNPTGLVLSTEVEDASDASIFKAGDDVAYASAAASFSFNPDLETPLTKGLTSVAITYGGESVEQGITVYGAGDTPTYATSTIDFENVLSSYSDWTFTNISRSNTITTASVTGSEYYGVNKNDKGNGVETASITTANKIAKPKSISFYYSKESTNTKAASWIIETSADGSNWVEVGSVTAGAGVTQNSWKNTSEDLSATNCYVRIYYSGNTAIRAIDHIVLTYQTN